MPEILHIIEPTLHDQTGHCYSHVNSLFRANAKLQMPLELWCGKMAAGLFAPAPGVTVHPHFSPTWRKLQIYFLYRKLLRGTGKIYLPTAGRTDLLLFHLASHGSLPPQRVYLFFHWLKLNPRKRRFLEKMAARHPGLVIMAPTAGVREGFQKAGFPNCHVIPYPITQVSESPTGAAADHFRYLLYAGAARDDKGFSRVVELVEHLVAAGQDLPVLVQTSPPHNGRYAPSVLAALERLRRCNYRGLQTPAATLDEAGYQQLYPGAICLQLYDRAEYAGERLSGVTLDALSGGSPILATSGTWMSRLVEQFQAGMALDDLSPAAVLAAAETLRRDFAEFARRARAAGVFLQENNDAEHLLRFVTQPQKEA